MSVVIRRCISINKRQVPLLANIGKKIKPQTAIKHSTTAGQGTTILTTKLLNQRFFSQALNQKECWNCKRTTKKINHFICSECGKLQDITQEYDYFELLSLPRDFNILSTKLTKSFRQLQTLVHPDKFGNKSEREQINSAEWSSLINKAYKTLSNTLVRGQYLLKLHGEEMPRDNSSLDKEFLMDMMERNEEVEEAVSREQLELISNKIQDEISEATDQLKDLFASNDLTAAKKLLVKMKYLLSIQTSIQTKLEKLLNL